MGRYYFSPLTSDTSQFAKSLIYSTDDELLVRDLRVGFVKGSDPDTKQQALEVGKCLHMIGVPRVDLALVSWRMEHNGEVKYPNVLNWSLPYEIIGVGVLDDAPVECGDE